MSDYPKEYHRTLQEGALRSAREIVPLVLDFIRTDHVIDVGCGNGAWLSVFKEHGIEDVQGIDGDWVEPEMLLIPAGQFVSADLEMPLQINKQFDLVVSLEVAEHVSPESAETFVDSLARLGPVILFSAAIPFQGGTNHYNEQWPSYWTKYFASRGFVALDCLRKRIWDNDNVEWWYAQNILFFVREDHLGKYPLLKAEYEKGPPGMFSVAHPRWVLERQKQFLELQQRETELLEQVSTLNEERKALRQRETELLEQVSTLNEERKALRQRETELLEQVSTLNGWAAGLRTKIADLEELKPGVVSLKKALRALPALIVHAIKRRL